MIKILLLLMLPLFLFASKILSYNVYDRTDRTDVMITFDTPFQGIIKEKSTTSKIVLTLSNVNIESPKLKKVSSKYIRTLSIIPLKNATQIVANITNSGVHLSASKTTDGYGLRLRFSSKGTTTKETAEQEPQNSLSMLPTTKGPDISNSYYIVIGIMLIGVFILLYLKKKVQAKQVTPKKAKKVAWLFESTNKVPRKSQETQEDENNNITIRFQKAIDEDNSVVMLDFGPQSYLVLMGKSNILLDKFTDEKPSSQEDFESILQSRHEELESFLSTTPSTLNNNVKEKNQEPLQAYKERAATLLYSDNQ